MKLKSLLWLILFGIVGYYGYHFVGEHFNQPAIAYKRYVNALMTGDSSRIKELVVTEQPINAFTSHDARMERLGGEPRLTWHDFLLRNESEDGKTVTLVVQYIVRVDPPGDDSYFGTEVRKDRHTVTLVKKQSAWKIASFEDSSTAAAKATKLSQR